MDTVSNLEDSLSVNGTDDTLAAIGVIFALCLSGYLMLVMMRSFWRRYEAHLSVLTDRVVRKHFSQMYALMVERVLCNGLWETMLNEVSLPSPRPWGTPMTNHNSRWTPPSSAEVSFAQPADNAVQRSKHLTVIIGQSPGPGTPLSRQNVNGGWLPMVCRLMNHLDVDDLEVLTPPELQSVMEDCNRVGSLSIKKRPGRKREVGERMWFMRHRTVEHVVRMAVRTVYLEYQAKLTGQFVTWTQKCRMHLQPSSNTTDP